jgi:hypothetical protein
MAAAIKFYAGQSGTWNELSAASGVGFYGATFGSSVQVDHWQDSTFICDSGGSSQGPAANNCKPVDGSTSGVTWNGASTSGVLRQIPNQSGTLNVRFTFDNPVKTQNAKFIVYDRSNKDNDPSGVTCYGAELRHPYTAAGNFGDWNEANFGSGNATWVNVHGSGSVLDLWASPGISGLRPNGADTTDTRHDWYLAVAAQPDSIGSKQFGFWAECEYL